MNNTMFNLPPFINNSSHFSMFYYQNEKITNNIKVKLPFELPKETILSIFMMYGDIENFSMSEKNIEISYFDINDAQKAFNELNFNINKFKSNDFEINYQYKNFFSNFFICFNFESLNNLLLSVNINCILKLVLKSSFVFRIYQKIINMNKAQYLIQFCNLKDKSKIEFMLRRILYQQDSNNPNKEQNNNFFNINNTIQNCLNIENDNLNFLNEFTIIYSYNKSLEYFCNSNQQNKIINNLNLNSKDYFPKKYVTQNQQNNNNNNLFQNHFISNQENINSLNLNSNNNNNNINLKSTLNNIKINNNNNNKNNSNKINNNKKEDNNNKFYTGIKKRNTSDEERKKYIINLENIINEIDQRTTLMIKNIPHYTSQNNLMYIFNNQGYKNEFNFFYLPIDFTKNMNAGYAFINFKNAKSIIKFYLEFNEKPWKFNQNKKCYLSYARIQGFRAITQHFQNSGIMNQENNEVKPYINDD